MPILDDYNRVRRPIVIGGQHVKGSSTRGQLWLSAYRGLLADLGRAPGTAELILIRRAAELVVLCEDPAPAEQAAELARELKGVLGDIGLAGKRARRPVTGRPRADEVRGAPAPDSHAARVLGAQRAK